MISEEGMLDRFEKVKRLRDGEWLVSCPAHDDRTPSLHVTLKDDRWLLKCQADCPTTDVLSAAELEWGDLFSENGNGKREIVETYPYIDDRGELLFEVVRFWPKGFAQRRPDGAGGWLWKLGDTRRVLYRLPQVLEAVEAGRTVWIVEGERDVHTLESVGQVATCNPAGAGKWREEFSKHLRGAKVAIIADRDEAGRQHAREVARSLEGVAGTVRTGEPAEGKDVSDHLKAGRGLDEFMPLEHEPKLRDGAPAPEAAASTLIDFTEIVARPVRWLWQDRIALGKLTALSGRPKIGKGLLYSHLIAGVTRGEVNGDLCEPREVILVTTEDAPEDVLKPRLMAAGADLARVSIFQMGTRDEPVPFRVPTTPPSSAGA